MFSLGMVWTNLYQVVCVLCVFFPFILDIFYSGEIQKSNCRRLEIATYFF